MRSPEDVGTGMAVKCANGLHPSCLASLTLLGLAILASPTVGGSPVLSEEQRVSKPSPVYTPQNDSSPRVAVHGPGGMVVWNFGPGFFGMISSAWVTMNTVESGDDWAQPRLFGLLDSGQGDYIPGRVDVIRDSTGRLWSSLVYAKRPGYGAPEFCIAVFSAAMDSGEAKWIGPQLAAEAVQSQQSGGHLSLDRPALGASAENSNIYLAYVQRELRTQDLEHLAEVWFQAKRDSSWTSPVRLAQSAAEGPRVVGLPGGLVVVMWHDLASSQIVVRRWLDDAAATERPAFDDPIVVSAVAANFSPPPRCEVETSRATSVLCERKPAPTYPALAVDLSRGPRRGWMYAVWCESLSGELEPVRSTIPEQEPNQEPWAAQWLDVGQEVSGTTSRGGEHAGGDGDSFTFELKAGETVQLSGEMTRSGQPQWWWCGQDLRLSQISDDRKSLFGSVGSEGVRNSV
jgi:hypothetical protein